jgi:acylpyruvate hydrolase
MRLATVRREGGTCAARAEDGQAVLLDFPDVAAVLATAEGWRGAGSSAGERVPEATLEFAPLVPRPGKIICVGLNYRGHIEESGAATPAFPTLFAKFSTSLVGATDPIVIPPVSEKVDWEVELVVVIGSAAHQVDEAGAADAIAGFTVGNDISARDFQARTSQWLQGKTFDSSTPVGPWLLTVDEVGAAPDLEIRCEVDGDVRQLSRTSDLLFGPAEIVSYISQIVTLEPGDLIFTGTPSGVGQSRTPPVFLQPGQTVTTSIEKIGSLVNPCVAG